jgi:NADH-ubiquinone oxidoreductase chain 5
MPLLILGLGSIFFGYITRDMIIGLGTSYFGNSIFVLPKNAGAAIDAEFIATSIK